MGAKVRFLHPVVQDNSIPGAKINTSPPGCGSSHYSR